MAKTYKYKKCVLCGERYATGGEHIPPVGIFLEPRPAKTNFITVPACDRCNGGTNLQDEKFKAFISLSIGTDTEERRALWKTSCKSARRTLNSNIPLRTSIVKRVSLIDVSTSSGILLGQAPATTWNYREVYPSIDKIVRGLYWKTSRKIMSPNAQLTFVCNQREGFDEYLLACLRARNDAKTFFPCGTQFVAMGVVENHAEDKSLWLLQFYESLFITVVTKHKVL